MLSSPKDLIRLSFVCDLPGITVQLTASEYNLGLCWQKQEDRAKRGDRDYSTMKQLVSWEEREGLTWEEMWSLVHGECTLLSTSQCLLQDRLEGLCMVFCSISNYFIPAHVNNYSGTASQQRAVCSPLELSKH